MSSQTSTVTPLIKTFKLRFSGSWILLGLGLILGVAIARLVVDENWQFALVLLFALPAFVLLYRYPLLALFIWLMVMPFLLTTNTVTYRRVYWLIHRALPPFTLGLVVFKSLSRVNRRKLPRMGLPEYAMVGYVVASLLSIYYLSESTIATTYIFYDRVFSPMCLYFIVRLTTPTQKDIERLMPIVFYIAFSKSLIGIISWISPQFLPRQWLELVGVRTTGSLVTTGVYTTTLTFAGLLVLHTAMNSTSRKVRILSTITFLLCAYCIFLSFSRASWLAAILVLPALVYLYPKFMIRLGLIASTVMFILWGTLLAEEFRWARQRLYSQDAERSAFSRLPVFYAAYRMFQEKPLTGWGYNNFDLYDRQFQSQLGDFYGDAKDHASHNLYLTVLAEQGLSGLILLLASLFWWLMLSAITLTRMPGHGFWSRKLLIIFWLVILSHIIVNNFSNMKVVFGLGMWWITLGLIASMIQPHIAAGEPFFIPRARRRTPHIPVMGYLLPEDQPESSSTKEL